MTQSYENLLDMFKTAPPRNINKQHIPICCPLARFFIILGGILTTTMIAMLIMFVILDHFGLLHSRGITADPGPKYFLIFIPIVIPQLAMLLFGISSYKKTKKLLTSGYLSKGTILTVKPLPARMNEKSFYKVRIKLTDSRSSQVITDMIDNYAVDYFLDARDNSTLVDILTLPDKTRGILLYKLQVSNRFD